MEIAAHFRPKAIGKHDFLLREGWVSDEYFFLSTGLMRAFSYDKDGNDVTTAFYTAEQIVFEYSSFFRRTPSAENIQALTDCEGWFITHQQMNALFHSRNEFREFVRSVLVKIIASLKSRMLSMIMDSATERYEHLLREAPQIMQHAPLKNIASYLGITNTSLSRIRARPKGNS
ncbi:Crp/Fnr family transcriptional regulator [Hymenobacter montanus]|uniref:Crp/Fnr family transcriptional regulator n=1 Tax=Hymenobacter montanus TaxID=2771359 RepID=UPI00293BD761|nr:Crp/Fnr family transcriptional regulator [Hymenobacter montanus]